MSKCELGHWDALERRRGLMTLKNLGQGERAGDIGRFGDFENIWEYLNDIYSNRHIEKS